MLSLVLLLKVVNILTTRGSSAPDQITTESAGRPRSNLFSLRKGETAIIHTYNIIITSSSVCVREREREELMSLLTSYRLGRKEVKKSK